MNSIRSLLVVFLALAPQVLVGLVLVNHGSKAAVSVATCSLKEEMTTELFGISTGESCKVSEKLQYGSAVVEHASFIRRNDDDDETLGMPGVAVWVSGYPRSGSSTILSMVSGTVDDNRKGENNNNVFSLFEPCHDGDMLKESKKTFGCPGVLYSLVRCDFSEIKSLWGWKDPHTTNNFTDYSPESAEELCQKSKSVAFKTVDYGHDLSAWRWFLDSAPGDVKMKVLDVVRDPRGIYASWKVLEPFATMLRQGTFYTLTEICENFERNLDFRDDRVYRVIFEDLLANPLLVTRAVYEHLDQTFSSEQEMWVKNAFFATECPPPPPGMEGFTDCHVASASQASADKWRSVLTEEELLEFNSSPACKHIAEVYGWPLDDAAFAQVSTEPVEP